MEGAQCRVESKDVGEREGEREGCKRENRGERDKGEKGMSEGGNEREKGV